MTKQISIITSVCLCVVVLFTYQNCGTESNTAGNVFAKSNEYPPPYDMKVNQIAYMSCSEQQGVANDVGVFFTFRAGAYGDDAGLRLSDDFLYETRGEDKFDKRDLLANDGVTVGTRIQMAVRSPTLLTRMFVNADSGSGTEGEDYDFIFGDLGSDEMSASLVTLDAGKYLSYWSPGGINPDAYFSATLVFNGSEALAQDVRNDLATNAFALTFGFSDPTDPLSIRTIDDYYADLGGDGGDGDGGTGGVDPGGDSSTGTSSVNGSSTGGGTTSVVASVPSNIPQSEVLSTSAAFGVGLRVSFKQPLAAIWAAGTTYPSMPKRVLASVSDFNLDNPNGTNSVWSCPNTLQFRVIHPDDLALSPTLCAVVHDPPVVDGLLKIVRNSLPASEWYVNLAQQCVIPRSYQAGSCYGIDSGQQVRRTPVYDVRAACNPAINNAGTGVCAHFVSICVHP